MASSNRHIAFAIRSKDYLSSAKALICLSEQDGLKLRTDDPIDQLVGHAFELALKASLLSLPNGERDIKSFSHRILELYDYLNTETDLLSGLSKQIATRWRGKLHAKRSELHLEFPTFASGMEAFGLPSENDISTMQFSVRNDVVWYDSRVSMHGNVFRYFQPRLEQIPLIKFGRSTIHRPRQSLIWSTEELLIPILQ